MIREIGLTPGLFSENEIGSRRESLLWRVLWHIEKEQHLIAIPRRKSWLRAVMEAIESWQGPFRDDITGLLKRIRDQRLIARQYQPLSEKVPENDLDWFREFLCAHKERPFDAIATLITSLEKCDDMPECAGNIGRVLKLPVFKNYEGSRRVRRTASEFIKLLDPVLMYSRKILLVDPHIRLSEPRYRTPINAFIHDAFNRGRYQVPKVFEIHLKVKEGEEDLLSLEKNIKKNLIVNENVPQKGIRVVFWAEKEKGQTFHNRFILSNVCGIHVGHGLDESLDRDDYDDWFVMKKKHKEEIWNQFQPNSNTFDLKHDFRLP